MTKRRWALLLVLLIPLALLQFSTAIDKNGAGRLLTGSVMDKQGHPLQDSVVYLSDTRTHAVKTYIVGPDGNYRFPSISSNDDYEVYAEYRGHKSETKTVSQFDDRQTLTINLRIEEK